MIEKLHDLRNYFLSKRKKKEKAKGIHKHSEKGKHIIEIERLIH